MKLLANLTRKEKTFLFISLIYILFNTFPLFADLAHISVQYVCIFVSVSLFALYPGSISAKSIKCFFAFVVVLFINAIMGRHIHINGLSNDTLPAMWRITIEIAWVLPALLMMSILQSIDKPALYKLFGYGSVLILAVSFLYILPLLMAYSNILRAASTEDSLDFARPLGLPDYTLMHAYVFMLPGLCMYMKKHTGRGKIISLFLIVLFYYVITQTAVSTSIVLGLFIIIFSLIIYDDRSKQKSLFLGSLAIGAFFVAYQTGLVLSFVDWLMPFFEGTAVSFKLQDVHDSIISGGIQGDSFDVRAERHELSRMSFLANPIIGGGRVGGHSHVLDTLGTVGLVGFIPFFMTIWTVMKNYINIVSKNDKIYMYLVFAISAVYLYNKGIFGSTGWLFMCVIAPSLIKAISNDTSTTNK